MDKLYRYKYSKKNNIDFLFFTAPWVKQGNGSFTSRVSVSAIDRATRTLNNTFFGTQELYLQRLVEYFFARYSEDMRSCTYYSYKSLKKDVLFLLASNSLLFRQSDFRVLPGLICSFNPYLSKEQTNSLVCISFIFATLQNKLGYSNCNLGLFNTYSVPAEISQHFFSYWSSSYRDSLPKVKKGINIQKVFHGIV